MFTPLRSLWGRLGTSGAPAAPDPRQGTPGASVVGETGATGLRAFGGVVAIDDGIDYLAAMRPPDRWGNVDKMIGSDASVRAAKLAVTLPLLSASLNVVPGSKSAVARQMAEFVESDLGGMTVHLDQHRRESFMYLDYGVYLFNKVFEYREDSLLHLRKLAPRPPRTVSIWHADDTGGPEGVTQWTPSQGSVRLDMPELLMLSHNMHGGNFIGESIFRSAYKAWWFKDKLEQLAAIGAEFHAKGIPVGKQSGKDKAVEREITRVLKAIRAHETTYVKESDEFAFRVEKPGVPQDLVPLINYFRTEIFVSTLNEALALGITGNQGSWALSQDKRSFAVMNLQAIAKTWETAHNRYLIAPWMRANFGNVASADLPRLEHGRLDTRGVAEWFKAVSDAVHRGVIPSTAELQQTAYELLDVPLPAEAASPTRPEERAADEPLETGPVQAPTAGADPRNLPGAVTARRVHAATTPSSGEAPRLESLVKLDALGIKPDFVRMAGGMDRGAGKIVQRVGALQDKQARRLAAIGAKIASRGPEGAGDIEGYLDIPYSEEADVIDSELGDLYDLGVDELGSEIEQQGGRYARPDSDRQAGDRKLLSGMALAAGALLASRMGAAWADEVLRQIATSTADRDAILSAAGGAGSALLASLAGQYVARALGTGRGAGISANVGAIEKLVNTEAMDGRTCEECGAADGVEVDPSDAAEVALYAPYYNCEGGDRCRGQLIPVVRN